MCALTRFIAAGLLAAWIVSASLGQDEVPRKRSWPEWLDAPPTDLPAPVIEIPPMDRLKGLMVGYTSNGPTSLLVGYRDPTNHVFYRWRGITIPLAWVYPGAGGSGPSIRDPAVMETMLSIDPPLDYVVAEDGLAEAGYFDRTAGDFYRWHGVRFDLAKVPAEWLGVRHNASDRRFPIGVRDIEVPAHRRELAEQLNATTRPSTQPSP
jgi:hypothetical protein